MHCGCSGHQAEEALHSLKMVVACKFLTVVLHQVVWSRILNPIFTHHPYIKVFLCQNMSILINNKSKAIIEHGKIFIHTYRPPGTLVFETPHLAT